MKQNQTHQCAIRFLPAVIERINGAFGAGKRRMRWATAIILLMFGLMVITATVSDASSTISLEASPSSITYGSGVALTVVVSPITSTGTVTFYDGATSLGTAALVSGSATATLTTRTLAVGSHTITAIYSSITSSSVTVTVRRVWT